MKNASKHAAALKTLLKRLIRLHKPGEAPQLDPLRALVMAVVMEDCDDRKAAAAMAAFDAEFVDVNELRVATELELADLMGPKYPSFGERSMRLRDLLMNLFDAEGRLSIDRLAAMGKKDLRAAMRGVPQMTPFVEGFMTLAGFAQTAVPLDETMRQFLVTQDVLEPETAPDEAQRFLEGNLKAEECWPFFASCRAAAIASRSSRAKPAVGGTPPKVPTRTSKSKAPLPAAPRRPRVKRANKQSA